MNKHHKIKEQSFITRQSAKQTYNNNVFRQSVKQLLSNNFRQSAKQTYNNNVFRQSAKQLLSNKIVKKLCSVTHQVLYHRNCLMRKV